MIRIGIVTTIVFILIVVISIYMLLDMQRLERSIDARFPPHGGAPLTPDQVRTRERVESLIRLAAPALNVVLAVGERISRIVETASPADSSPGWAASSRRAG